MTVGNGFDFGSRENIVFRYIGECVFECDAEMRCDTCDATCDLCNVQSGYVTCVHMYTLTNQVY